MTPSPSTLPLPFFDHGVARLDALLSAPLASPLLCAFDFDGTLAPIVADPACAAMPPTVRQRLLALQAHAPVAILSGRSLADVGPRLGFRPDYLVGNHGAEGLAGWERQADDYRARCAQWHRQLAAALRDHARYDPAIVLENKTCSLSLHYRHVRQRRVTEAALLALSARLQPAARVIGGKYVINLLPPEAPDKGAALLQLCAANAPCNAFYAGDDDTDETVFRLHRPDWLTVRVEPAAGTDADFYLPHPHELLRVLDLVLARLQRQAGAKRAATAATGAT